MTFQSAGRILLPENWLYTGGLLDLMAGMDLLSRLTTAELQVGDFLVPWGMVVGTLGFLLAWLVMVGLEHFGWTRRIWNVPLFFVALAVLFGCVIGLLVAP
jgi:hypothetical protein